MTLQELKAFYLAPRTEEEKERGTLLGFLIYCYVCPRVAPDTNVVIFNRTTPKEAYGRCETCQTQHVYHKNGTVVWYDKTRPSHILGFVQWHDDESWNEMIQGEQRALEFARASKATA